MQCCGRGNSNCLGMRALNKNVNCTDINNKCTNYLIFICLRCNAAEEIFIVSYKHAEHILHTCPYKRKIVEASFSIRHVRKNQVRNGHTTNAERTSCSMLYTCMNIVMSSVNINILYKRPSAVLEIDQDSLQFEL